MIQDQKKAVRDKKPENREMCSKQLRKKYKNSDNNIVGKFIDYNNNKNVEIKIKMQSPKQQRNESIKSNENFERKTPIQTSSLCA